MRRVIVSDWKYNENTKKNEFIEIGEAIFHGFGYNCEESPDGIGNYSTAIVEWPNGSVKNVYVENIRFLDKPEGGECQTKSEN